MKPSALVTVLLVALAGIAISRSPTKLRTLLFIMGWMAIGLAVGIVIGLVLGSTGLAGTLAAIGTQWAGIAACINRMVVARRLEPLSK